MAELAPKDRLQPSLLDRLLDEDPGQRRDRVDRRILDVRRLKESVKRDVTWLLNTTHYTPQSELDAYPQVRKSVLNYGIADFAGLTKSRVDVEALESSITEALAVFEPRLVRNSIRVRVLPPADSADTKLDFEVECTLWAQPVPLSLLIRTEMDLETGAAEIQERSK